jgi:hypothetical protein
LESINRTQFQIDVSRVRQEARDEFLPAGPREIIRATLRGVPRRHDERRPQQRDLFFQLLFLSREVIQPQLKKIGRMRHFQGKLQVGPRGDHSNHFAAMGLPGFDRILCCHILFAPHSMEAMIAEASLF